MIFEKIFDGDAFKKAERIYGGSGSAAMLKGMNTPSVALFCAALFAKKHKKCIIITKNDLETRTFTEDLLTLGAFDADRVLTLNPLEYMLYQVEAKSGDNEAARVKTLFRLQRGEWDVLVTSLSAAAQKLPLPGYISSNCLILEEGQRSEPFDLADRLASLGYIRVPQIDGTGQFASRGDIIDVFPVNAQNPARIEFFDDEIDTIRSFDVLTQRTVERIGAVGILPERETYIWDEQTALAIRTDLKAELYALDSRSSEARILEADIEKIKPFARFPGYDKYLPYILQKSADLFDYCGKIPVFVNGWKEALESADQTQREYVRIAETVRDSSGLPEKTAGFVRGGEETLRSIRERAGSLLVFDKFDAEPPYPDMETADAGVMIPDAVGDNPEKLFSMLADLSEKGFSGAVFSDSEGRTRKLAAALSERGLTRSFTAKQGKLSEGFIIPSAGIAAVTDGILFRHSSARARKKLRGETLSSFADLRPGDLVVHDVHGIGRFDGIEAITIDNIKKDYIRIAYRDDGVIFVPTHQLDSVKKYIGNDDSVPQLSKLGSSEWKKATAKVRNGLRVYAKELVELYARRMNMRGYAFSRDTDWQNQFEADFPYEETDDQLRCTEEIKADMEKPQPMDRLLCGDVGYGKTEVALRAAFKAVVEGKQVAVLVPTTVLARQHYSTFAERLKKFPVKVDYLCRFRTANDAKKIVAALSSGELDIVIGTHALINDKIAFKDLGLVIIDEEQRFGVKHKEKLKEKYPSVDTLSLSATPIPRTLHMSLSGIRDISVLEDPPQDRLPVQTYVAEWDGVMVKNAVYKEMARGGQIFYLYNRIETMDRKLRELHELVPEARIAAAHGQMNERELERIMLDFYQGDFDVLLCTTIIESGLDMPNVNTVIVENGERMGLSQLYQIRGRVGRSTKQAYAYITYRRGRELPEMAEKRLRAIRENTEFGSGFKIALRDLEIRGAGSVLGEQQHGQIAAVGYETYCRLLNEVLEEERTGKEKTAAERSCSVEMSIPGFIDPAYIENDSARFEIYQKIARVENEDDAMELTDELIDRFGPVPDNIMTLISVAQIRHMAEYVGFTSVIQKEDRVLLYSLDADWQSTALVRPGITETDAEYVKFHAAFGKRLRISRTRTGSIVTFSFPGGGRVKDRTVLADTKALLSQWVKIR